jgi:hypothetical protein
MAGDDMLLWYLTLAGGALMALALLRGISTSAWAGAQDLIDQRRAQEAQRRAEKAAAEAAGQAAALEPLNLNADGSIEEPIVGVVEGARGA